jgi:hypothetical protein
MLFPGGHAASICENTPEAICRVLEEEEEEVLHFFVFSRRMPTGKQHPKSKLKSKTGVCTIKNIYIHLMKCYW